MSYETVIEQVKATPVELLDEVSVFLNFLKYRSTQNQSKQKKMPDETYNLLADTAASAVTNSAREIIWEQIKNDTW